MDTRGNATHGARTDGVADALRGALGACWGAVSTAVLIAAAALAAPAAAQSEQDASGVEALYDGLEWRFIGPYRGGRVAAVAGVIGDPLTYYMGATGGGVWKTTNAGATWANVSDADFNVGTIGAIAVAPSDPNVVYVGAGESPIRGVTTSHGDGVYVSTDAGAHWRHVGLDATRQISALVVHPSDPDTAWVAAQGNPWGPNDERGVFKTDDGGETWRHVLAVDADTGASDLVMDPANPRILYAGMWAHRRSPWFVRSGGESGGIFKSVDGGETWEKLEGGLPELVGKIGVAVAPSNPSTIYAIVEAQEGGLYVSTDSGASWSRKNDSRIIQARAWYYNHINVDPDDENTVYILNAPLLKSIDGGDTFAPMSAPHGDHHDMWFNPDDGDNFINANDGGATVTFDGGATWSSIYNQPTAQFYRVATDNMRPFTVYGGQQDNTTIAIKSDAYDGAIGRDDYEAVGGGESAHIAFDPDNPRYIYATTINATLTEYDAELERTRPIKPYPEYVFGRNARDHKYRFNWNAPIIASPHDPSVLYYGAQVLLKSTDRGVTWEEVSGDLTKNDLEKQGLGGGPITNEQAGAEFYNTIFYIVESPHEQGVIWVGSDDGLVHLTRNGGETWTNVTPRGVGEAHINAIEVSPHDPAKAYIAVAGYKSNDFTPSIYETTNYGAAWRRIDRGLPQDTFARVVREDPRRAGLLFAGTEAGLFVSFDGGEDGWSSLDLNLPPVPITDLAIRHDRLVAATQGRGFWILDELNVVQQVDSAIGEAALHLFEPAPAVRGVGGAGNPGAGDPSADAAPRAAALHAFIGEEVALEDATLTIVIRDAEGASVRTLSSEETENDRCREANADPRNPLTIERPAAQAGLNRWTWDLRRDALRCAQGVRLFAGFAGPRVTPGTYTVEVRAGEETAQTTLTVAVDPRVDAAPEDYAELADYVARTSALLEDLMARVEAARAAKRQIEAHIAFAADHEEGETVADLGEAAIERLEAWIATVTQPKHETFEDDINWPNMLDVQVRHVLDALDRADLPVTAGAKERYGDLEAAWTERGRALDAITAETIAPFNEALAAMGADHAPAP